MSRLEYDSRVDPGSTEVLGESEGKTGFWDIVRAKWKPYAKVFVPIYVVGWLLLCLVADWQKSLLAITAVFLIVAVLLVALGAAYWLAVLIHELGHYVACLVLGFSVEWVAVPGVKVFVRERRIEYGSQRINAVASRTQHCRHLRARYVAMIAAGPTASATVALACILLPVDPFVRFLLGFLNGYFALATLASPIPASDGSLIRNALKSPMDRSVLTAVALDCPDFAEVERYFKASPWVLLWSDLNQAWGKGQWPRVAELLAEVLAALPPDVLLREDLRAWLGFACAHRGRDLDRARSLVEGLDPTSSFHTLATRVLLALNDGEEESGLGWLESAQEKTWGETQKTWLSMAERSLRARIARKAIRAPARAQ